MKKMHLAIIFVPRLLVWLSLVNRHNFCSYDVSDFFISCLYLLELKTAHNII